MYRKVLEKKQKLYKNIEIFEISKSQNPKNYPQCSKSKNWAQCSKSQNLKLFFITKLLKCLKSQTKFHDVQHLKISKIVHNVQNLRIVSIFKISKCPNCLNLRNVHNVQNLKISKLSTMFKNIDQNIKTLKI